LEPIEQGGVGTVVMSAVHPRPRKKGTSMRTLAMIVGTLALLSATAFAQGKGKTPAAGNAGNAGNAKVKVYDFSGDTIEGDLIKPEGTTVDARDFAKHSSLIRIRKDFIAEILKSAEDL
jgi:hypothetical protein